MYLHTEKFRNKIEHVFEESLQRTKAQVKSFYYGVINKKLFISNLHTKVPSLQQNGSSLTSKSKGYRYT